ncbi:MAG: signal peptide peptidase SppA [Firmicutes bacterium]|nr:signal peptide peptidase SppA [Bacillota bacterium]
MENNQFTHEENKTLNKPQDKKRNNGCLIATVIVGAILICITILTVSAIGAITKFFSSAEVEELMPTGNYVETLFIEGTISESNTNAYGMAVGYDHNWTLDEIDKLIEDENNKGILLYFNSGGGGTYESDEMYLALKKYKKETGRPIYAYYAQTAASGAVYISMAADEIYSNRMTMTGSIGVMIQSYDASELMDKIGIKETNVISGRNKDMGNETGLNEEQRAIMQSLVDESYEIFVGIVSEERGIPLDKTKELADGRLYSPLQAKELGLIDHICSYDEFMEEMKAKEEFKNCEFIEGYPSSESVWSFILSKANSLAPKSFEKELLEKVEHTNLNPVQFKYSGF